MPLLVEVGLVVLAAAAIVASIAFLPRPSRPRWTNPRPRAPSVPEQLDRVERIISGATVSALHAHAYLRPVLVEISTRRLASHGQILERISDEACRELLGERLWELVRPGRPFPEDRHAPGVSLTELADMLDALERL